MKKYMACLMALVMSAMFVLAQPLPVQASAGAGTEPDLLGLTTTASSLNYGDVVTIVLSLNSGISATSLEGYLKFDEEVFSSPYITETASNMTAYYDGSSRKIYCDAINNGTNVGTLPTGKLCTINLFVIKAVNETQVSFEFPKFYQYYSNGYSYVTYTSDVSVKLTNTKVREIAVAPDTVSGSSTVTVPVKLSKNPGFTSLTLEAVFNSNMLSFATVESADSKIRLGKTIVDKDKVTLDILANEEIKSTGTLVNFVFRVVKKTTTSPGNLTGGTVQNPQHTSIDVSITSASDVLNPILTNNNAFKATGARIDVIISDSQLLGDVNGNNKIDLIDALYIIQYYNKERTLTTVAFTAADVNQDGKVNLVDALRILEFYNGKVTYL